MARKKTVPNRVDELLDELIGDDPTPEDILGESGLLKQLSKRMIERARAGDLTYHLNHEAPTIAEGSSTKRNSRNGYSKKTIQSEQGAMELSIPRDRAGDFEPLLVAKGQRRIAGLDEKILAMYARGTSTRDIRAQLLELYGANVSESLISEVTNSVLDEVKAWRTRPLDEVYPIVYLDALYVNIKVNGQVSMSL